MSDSLPLTGLRVVELDAIGPVPFAGLKLAQLGAEVTRIRPPGERGIGLPLPPRFDLLNQQKSEAIVDLKSAAGQASLQQRLIDADVLLEGFRPGVLERLNLHPDVLAERYPTLILGRLSGFGRHGELASRAGHDINYLALSGVLSTIGPADAPCIPLNLIGDFGGGAMHLLLGVLALLARRGISGQGGMVDTSILAGTIGLTPLLYGQLAASQWQLQRQQNSLDGGWPFYRTYATSDNRHVAVGALEPQFYAELLKLTELNGQLHAKDQYKRETWPAIAEAMDYRFRERSRDDWAALSLRFDCCLTPVLDPQEAACYPHSVSQGWYSTTPFAQPASVLAFR